MRLFAIGDPHLSFGCDKPMVIFKGWHDHVSRFEENWHITVSAEDTQPQERGVQVVAATVIGLFSLSILLLLRWFGMPEDSAATAMAAQFRDFVSGCVGFLIGCPTDKGNQTSS